MSLNNFLNPEKKARKPSKIITGKTKRKNKKILSKEEIIKKKLCVTCDLKICNNSYELCVYRYNPEAHLCLTCSDLNNDIGDDGHLKCYETCLYRNYKTTKKIWDFYPKKS